MCHRWGIFIFHVNNVYRNTDTETDNTASYTIKKIDNEHTKSSCAPPNRHKATVCTTKVYVGTELHYEPWFARSLPNIMKQLDIVVSPPAFLWTDRKWRIRAHHALAQVGSKILYYALMHKTCLVFACSLWPIKKWKMSGRPPFLADIGPLVHHDAHNASWWCTTQVDGAQRSPVLMRWWTT